MSFVYEILADAKMFALMCTNVYEYYKTKYGIV